MKTVSSSQARQNFSSVIKSAAKEPVAISKKEKDIVVILPFSRYKELKKLEDILYGKAAELAIKEGFASDKETKDLLDKI